MASRTREEKQRALLFGSRDVAHRRPTSTGVTESVGGGDEMLEAANSGKVNGLRGRVGEMRHLALDLGTEVREHNALLDGMGGTMEQAGDGLGRTIGEIRRLARSAGGGHMCILFVFAFVFFILIYLLLR